MVKLILGVPLALGLGFSFWQTLFVCFVGGSMGVLFFAFFSQKLIDLYFSVFTKKINLKKRKKKHLSKKWCEKQWINMG